MAPLIFVEVSAEEKGVWGPSPENLLKYRWKIVSFEAIIRLKNDLIPTLMQITERLEYGICLPPGLSQCQPCFYLTKTIAEVYSLWGLTHKFGRPRTVPQF